MLTSTYTHHTEVKPTISDDFRFFLCYTGFVKRYDFFKRNCNFKNNLHFMSYGVRGMEKKLLFSNRYEKDMDLFDDLPDDMPELSDIDDAKVPTIDDFYEYMNKKRRCVPNKERIVNKDQFIKTVSELSETYKINADLSEFDVGYIADIYLDYANYCGYIKKLLAILFVLADDISLFDGHKADSDMLFSFTYHTHNVYLNNREITDF